MRVISATIVAFSGAVCIAAGALSDSTPRGGWAIAAGLGLAGIGTYVWAALIGWISTDWATPREGDTPSGDKGV